MSGPGSAASSRVARFGKFEVDLTTGELRKGGRTVRLQDQPFQVLLLLLQQPGHVITREVLHQRLWAADTFVDFDQGLNNAVRRLRDALGDSAETPRYVETLPRLGYRFVAAVEWEAPPTAAESTPPDPLPAEPGVMPASRPQASPRVVLALIVAVAAVAVIVAGLWWHSRSASPARVMLAVLPFENMSDTAGDYLSDGLTEEMISQLGALSPDRLGVIARTSAMRYKDVTKSAADIGRELGVSYLLEGSVRRSGDRVRISARLIGVADQTPRWSHVFETDLVDMLTTQKDVARAVVDEMRLQLSQSPAAGRHPPVNPVAYEIYLRGRQAWNRRTAKDLRDAVDDFERALAVDPLSAQAYAGLADAYSLLSLYDSVAPADAFPRAKAAALKALELDPLRAEVHTSLAYIAYRYEWDWAAAERSFLKSLELNPSYATAHHWYAELLIATGRHEEARLELHAAQQFDPLSPRITLDVSLPDYFAGRTDRAIDQARRVTKLYPDFVPAWVSLRQYSERHGRYDQAIAALRETARLLGLRPDGADRVEAAYRAGGSRGYWTQLLEMADREWPTPETPAHRANMYAALGESSQALAWLERALAEHDDELVWIAVEPWYEPLRDGARFQRLVSRLGLSGTARRVRSAAF